MDGSWGLPDSRMASRCTKGELRILWMASRSAAFWSISSCSAAASSCSFCADTTGRLLMSFVPPARPEPHASGRAWTVVDAPIGGPKERKIKVCMVKAFLAREGTGEAEGQSATAEGTLGCADSPQKCH